MKQLTKKRYVYFIRAVDSPDGRIKIGCSYKPIRRLLALAAWSSYPLEVIAVAPGDFSTERSLHDFFAADRLHSEWFRSSPELLGVIEDMSRGVPLYLALSNATMARAA